MYEAHWATHPAIPISLMSNRTSLSGYIVTFIHGVVITSIGYYLPTWFQSVHVATPIKSSIYFLPMMVIISTIAIVEGLIVSKLGRYRAVNFIGWCMLLLGLGLFISVRTTTSLGIVAVFQIIEGVGMGLLYATTFVALASLPVSDNAAAVSLLAYVWTFSQSWGVVAASAILQNKLESTLPGSVLQQFPDRANLVYGVIPAMSDMPQPLKRQVQDAFLESMRLVWIVMAGCSAVGLLSVFLVKDIPLARTVDKKWGLKEKGTSAVPQILGVEVEISVRSFITLGDI
ncbi:major facilitator superfamily domain-containing protein [Mycena latifolia]|nr:major facilitator superfamily domain-containing protein [Mycena latifolia]